jgi:hypothetical protein
MLADGGGRILRDRSLLTFAMTLSRRYAKILPQPSEAILSGRESEKALRIATHNLTWVWHFSQFPAPK